MYPKIVKEEDEGDFTKVVNTKSSEEKESQNHMKQNEQKNVNNTTCSNVYSSSE